MGGAAWGTMRPGKAELAEMIRGVIDPKVAITIVPTDDLRSYHLSAERLARELGFRPSRPLEQAVRELREALTTGQVPEPAASIYRNVAHMNAHPELWRWPPEAAR